MGIQGRPTGHAAAGALPEWAPGVIWGNALRSLRWCSADKAGPHAKWPQGSEAFPPASVSPQNSSRGPTLFYQRVLLFEASSSVCKVGLPVLA